MAKCSTKQDKTPKFTMPGGHEQNCECSSKPQSAAQTLDELEFERGIWTAAIDNDVTKIEKILSHRQDPNLKDGSGYTALHYAARAGHAKAISTLLDHGADPNAQTPSGKTTPLHRAAYMGHINCIELLIKGGGKVDLVDSDGKSALHKCAEKGQYECAKLLLEKSDGKKGELLAAKDANGHTPYDQCSVKNKNLRNLLLPQS